MGEEAQVTLNTIDGCDGCHDDDYDFNQDLDYNDLDDDVVSFSLLIQSWYMVTSICVYGIQIIDLTVWVQDSVR